jgi:hypothetical protein
MPKGPFSEGGGRTVSVTAEKVMERYPLQLDVQVLRRVLEDTEKEIALYERIVRDFEAQWGCDLVEFEKRLAEGELPEHPSWEISIEWGVAADELQKLRVIDRGLTWILNFLS